MLVFVCVCVCVFVCGRGCVVVCMCIIYTRSGTFTHFYVLEQQINGLSFRFVFDFVYLTSSPRKGVNGPHGPIWVPEYCGPICTEYIYIYIISREHIGNRDKE